MVITAQDTKLKPGFKQTEVGVIPVVWEISSLETFISFISYGFTNPMPSVENGVYMITAKDINHGKIQFDTARCTSEEAYQTLLTAKSRPKKDDLLLTKDGTLGRLALVDNRKVCMNQSVAVLRPNSKIEPKFLKVLLEAPLYQNRMLEEAGGSTIKHIYVTIVNRMPVAVPSNIDEQNAIANVLSDTEDLIERLEELIAKKRDIKQATMQQLLTGKTRLPGFSRELKPEYKRTEVGEIPKDWDLKRLGEIGECLIGLTYQPSDVKSEGLLVLRASNIADSGLVFTDNVFVNVEVLDKLILLKDDLLICVRNGSRNLIGKCALIDDRAKGMTFGAFMSIFRTKYSHFVFYQFQSKLIKRQIHENIGATINQITNKNLNSFQIPLPSLSEQRAIVNILSDMDAEIGALEQQRDKTRALKQGMMQELLTGKTRLV